MIAFITTAITCAVLAALSAGLSTYVNETSYRWHPLVRYLIALPHALIGGVIAISGAMLLLIIQRFFIPIGEFEANVMWYEAIIVPAAYSLFFYSNLSILPRYYLVISSTIAVLFTIAQIGVLLEGPTDMYIADLVSQVFYTEKIPSENSLTLSVVQLASSVIGTIYTIYSNNKS